MLVWQREESKHWGREDVWVRKERERDKGDVKQDRRKRRKS
jgi:hypothetical protein